MIISLKPNQIFVFGSNLAGIHGAGAAKQAYEKFGAVMHKGVGHYGQSYALPTKDRRIETLDLQTIQQFVNHFLTYAQLHPELEFLLTPIGCGLAGYEPKDIAPMFKSAPTNVILPPEFKEIL